MTSIGFKLSMRSFPVSKWALCFAFVSTIQPSWSQSKSVETGSSAKSAVVKVDKKAKVKKALTRFDVDSENTQVTLRLAHNLLGRFETQSKGGLKGSIYLIEGGKIVTESLEFTPDTFESLIGLRDDHIKKDYLETHKFPKILMQKAATLVQKFEQSMNDTSMAGTLVVKDHPEKVVGVSQVYLENELLRGKLEFNSKISLFPIQTPKYKGVGVGDEFSILVELVARPYLGESEEAPTGL